MKNPMVIAALLGCIGTVAAGQQTDLTLPDMSNPEAMPETCAAHREANPTPAWTFNLTVREGYRALLLQQIYRALAAEAVVETGACSCETRYPDWSAANAIYQERYHDLDMFEHQRVGREFSQRYNRVRRDMLDLCEALETQ